MNTSRRGAIRAILGASVASVAAHFGVSRTFAADMQREVGKIAREDAPESDFEGWLAENRPDRTQIAVPSETFGEKSAIWYSVAGIAEVWGKEIAQQARGLFPKDTFDEKRTFAAAHKMADRMARAIDEDFKTAQVPHDEQRVLVQTPLVRRMTQEPAWGNQPDGVPRFEIVAGLHTRDTIFGNTAYVVGYGGEKIIGA